VGVSFVGGSIISPGMAEANEHNLKDGTIRCARCTSPIRVRTAAAHGNLLLHHGVRSALEYASSGDLQKAHAVRNPELAPHLAFVDVGGHGYATGPRRRQHDGDRVRLHPAADRAQRRRGWLDRCAYRVRNEVPLWRAGERPQMRTTIVEGDAGLAA
jgi:alkaline phosphatase D